MPRPSLSRLTSAHAIALLALFISLGGTSYAVTKLPKNSVASPQVKDGSLTAKDLASGVVTAGPQGTPGPRGPRGTEGQTGPAGPTGVRGADGSNALPTIRIASTGDSAIALTATSEYQFGKVLTMPNVPAGTYRIDLTGTVDLEPAKPAPSATAAVIAYCSMYVYGVSQQESSAVRVSIVGTILKVDAIHSDRSTLADTGVVTMKEPFTLFLLCTGNIVAPKVQLVHTKLTMTPLQSFAVVAQ